MLVLVLAKQKNRQNISLLLIPRPKKEALTIMEKKIFDFDPFIGCPFDRSEMTMVQSHGQISVGKMATFRGPNIIGTMHHPQVKGEVIAIGENAKYCNGQPFVAFAIRVGNTVHLKSDDEVQQVN